MLTFSSAYKIAKNAFSSKYPWITLLEVSFASTTLRLCDNNEDVSWDSQTWTKFDFFLSDKSNDSKGTIPSTSLSVSNINRIVQGYVDANDGLRGATVTLRLVRTDILSESAAIEFVYTIKNTITNENYCVFELGTINPMIKPMLQTYWKDFCRWGFKETACGYLDIGRNGNTTVAIGDKTVISTNCAFETWGLSSGDVIEITNGIDTLTTTVDTITNETTMEVNDASTFASSSSDITISHATCNKTFEGCTKRRNYDRFGGFPGIPFGTITRLK